MSKDFVHLHVHSEYSLLDGLANINKMVEKAKKQGAKAIALTDHGSMYGVIEFYKKCKKEGIKPIVGCEIYMSEDDHKKKKRRDAYHLTVWAKDLKGYKNLMKIVSIGHLEGFYYKPRVDMDILDKYSEGLMASSGCASSLISKQLLNESYENAKDTAEKFVEIFGADDFYIELQRHPYEKMANEQDVPEKVKKDLERMEKEQETIEEGLIKLSRELGLPIIATNDSHYVEKEDAVAQDAVVCIQTGKMIDEVDRMRYVDTPDFYLKSAKEMKEIFADLPEAIENTSKLAEKVDLEIKLGEWYFPKFDLPEGKTAGEALRDMAYKGAEERFEKVNDEIKERLDYELKIIDDRGYSPYFLIYADMTRYATENGIFVNTRGSAAGSLVSYCCGITTVDPLRYDLPFERFLNPYRPSPPDIDLDISDDRRDDMINYLRDKYGDEKVAQICTFGTMKARAAVRDVGRVMGMPYSQPDRVSKMIPLGSQGFKMTLDRALKESKELKRAYKSEEETRELIDMAKKIEGNVRHISVHAAAVVASPTDMTDYTPLQTEPGSGDKVITQYEMHACEDVGLIKLDILGIRNLSIMANAITLIEKLRGVEIDIYDIPLDDKQTFEMLSKGRTFGVFQLASSGMTRYLMELEPERIEDIMQMVALYRPGPMSFIPEYIKRKHNPELVEYMDPRMEDILESSYGVIVYQDDVLYIALELAGYDWGEADKFRKAIGKKIPEEMEKQRDKFINGCIENGMDKKLATELFSRIETFAAYGFNKCVTGDTVVYLTDVCRPITVAELYGQKIADTSGVLGLGQNGKISGQKVKVVKQNGVKKVYRLKTRSGREIKASENHPFLTYLGYRRLEELKEGDRIAVARKLPADNRLEVEDYKLELLAYLLAEGNLCHPHGVYFYNNEEAVRDDFTSLVSNFKNSKTRYDEVKNSIYVGQGEQRKGNFLKIWLNDLGVDGLSALEKSIPSFVFGGDEEQIGRFIGKLFTGDGSIDVRSGQVYYATSSHALAKDLQSLLLKLEIQSVIYTKRFKYRGGYKTGYTVNISHRVNLLRLFEKVYPYLVGYKREQFLELKSKLYSSETDNSQVSSLDTVPAGAMAVVKEEIKKAGFGLVELAEKAGISERILHYDKRKRGYTRKLLRKVNTIVRSDILQAELEKEVFWDEVVSIELAGEEMTYDLTLEGEHNFLANDFVVHNSHAASYGMVSYWTAYLKANYPIEYMTALLTAESGNTDKLVEAINECEEMGIKILPPDVNQSLIAFTIVEEDDNNRAIRFGLSAIKNVGEAAVEAILKERKENGEFSSLSDFCMRVDARKVNKKVLESLIKSGAMDRFGERAALMAGLENIRNKATSMQKKREVGQESLFGGVSKESNPMAIKDSLPDVEPWSKKDKLRFEKELLGFYLSDNPIKSVMDKMESLITHRINQLDAEHHVGQTVKVVGMITDVRKVQTKRNNDSMAFGEIEDDSGSLDIVIFPTIYDETRGIWEEDKLVFIEGKVDNRDDSLNLLVGSVELVENVDEPDTKVRRIKIPRGTNKSVLRKISDLLRDNPGDDRVKIVVPNNGGPKIIDVPFTVDYSKKLDSKISKLLD